MSKIFLVSDTHFSHNNIIKYSNRPFQNAQEMDETLITNWNAVVKPGDRVYHLGDFGWGDPKPVLTKLNGQKHLILGNHDDVKMHEESKCWAWIKNYYELKDNGNVAVLFHYPMRSWNKAFHGSWHFFGHVHNRLKPYGRSRDIGVDTNNYYPISLEDAMSSVPDLKHEEHGD